MSMKKLEVKKNSLKTRLKRLAYDPGEARDKTGKWSGSATSTAAHMASSKAFKTGSSKDHALAATAHHKAQESIRDARTKAGDKDAVLGDKKDMPPEQLHHKEASSLHFWLREKSWLKEQGRSAESNAMRIEDLSKRQQAIHKKLSSGLK